MNRIFLLVLIAALGLSLDACQKQQTEAERNAEIERQVQQMVRMVDDLLDVSRITRGKITLRTESVDVAAVVADAVETSRPLIDARRQELSVTVPPALSVGEGHDVAKEVRHQLLHHLPHLGSATIHIDPDGHGGEQHHRIDYHSHDGLPVHSHD